MEYLFLWMLAAAVAPPLYLIHRVWRLDRIEKEPVKLMVRLFFRGVLSAIPAVLLENLAERLILHVTSSEMSFLILEMFVGVALVEEGVKFFFLKRGTWRNPSFDYVFDGVVYAVVVSLGFAAIENVFYVADGGILTALMRALTSIPGHCIFGICMGHYYGKAKSAEREGDPGECRNNLIKCLLYPVIIHGFYDFIISVWWENAVWVFLLYVIILDVAAFIRVRRFAREDRPVGNEWEVCQNAQEEAGHE